MNHKEGKDWNRVGSSFMLFSFCQRKQFQIEHLQWKPFMIQIVRGSLRVLGCTTFFFLFFSFVDAGYRCYQNEWSRNSFCGGGGGGGRLFHWLGHAKSGTRHGGQKARVELGIRTHNTGVERSRTSLFFKSKQLWRIGKWKKKINKNESADLEWLWLPLPTENAYRQTNILARPSVDLSWTTVGSIRSGANKNSRRIPTTLASRLPVKFVPLPINKAFAVQVNSSG